MESKMHYIILILSASIVSGSIWNQVLENLQKIELPFLQRNDPFPPLPNSFRMIQTFQSTTVGGSCSSIFNCASCSTVQICKPTNNGTLVPFINSTCPKQTPYCSTSTGTCTSIPDKFCGEPDEFFCPSDGYFPDATNCTIYHACNDLKSSSFICGASNYNPDNQSCVFNGSCSRANCTGLTGLKKQIGKSHYFAYCINGKPELVDRCQGNYNLNYTSQKCEPICTTNGIRTDYEDCTKYYKCSSVYINPSTRVFVRQHLNCSADQAFDSLNYMCMPKNQTNCQVKQKP